MHGKTVCVGSHWGLNSSVNESAPGIAAGDGPTPQARCEEVKECRVTN